MATSYYGTVHDGYVLILQTVKYTRVRGGVKTWPLRINIFCSLTVETTVLDREWRIRTASRWRGERGAGP